MLPDFEIASYYRQSILKNVEKWLPCDQYEHTDQDLHFGLPPEFGSIFIQEARYRDETRNNELDRQQILEEKAIHIYQIVLNVLGEDKFKVSSQSKWDEKESFDILRRLQIEGYRVNESDIDDIRHLVTSVKDNRYFHKSFGLRDSEIFRHASLNCYDYERLKEEMKRLESTIDITKITTECRTLYKIYMEALNNENAPYPGRHLTYNRIGGIKNTSAQRYQSLRMIDEILCSNCNDRFYTREELEAEIRKLAKSYGIQFQKSKKQDWIDFENYSFTDKQFDHLFNILKQLICIEHASGKTKTHERNVFDTEKLKGAASGNFKNNGAIRYKKQTNGKRLSAFTVDIAVHEIKNLRKEIGTIRAKYFGDDRASFASKFPLIATLGYTEEIVLDQEFGDEMLKEINQTDLKLVIYKSLKYGELKKKVKEVISLQLPIAIKKGDEWLTVYPIAIKEYSSKWIVIAKAQNITRPILISPELLHQTFETYPESFKEDYSENIENHFIGTGDFIMDNPQNVVLELTYAGMKEVDKKNSAFTDISPNIEWTISRKIDGYRRAGLVRLNQVYINEDFLQEIFRLDCTGKLRSIEPECFSKLYKSYFVKWAGQEWRHIDDRPVGNKYVKINKSKLNE